MEVAPLWLRLRLPWQGWEAVPAKDQVATDAPAYRRAAQMWSLLRPQFRVAREPAAEATAVSDRWREQVRRSCHRLPDFREPEMAIVVMVAPCWPAAETSSPHRHRWEMASAPVETAPVGTAQVEMAPVEAAARAICPEGIWEPEARPPEVDRSPPDRWNRWSRCPARVNLNHPRRQLPTRRVKMCLYVWSA
ncbi:MAG: hypothetical protein DMG81_10755 [Acidobacteria bacterium]|nr:MAG: hypothetical protein DMG81_10755 [Acidobacteriota bacterium]